MVDKNLVEKICGVTVTYGNRFFLVKQVIESALNAGVNRIIVVDNNSEEESHNKLLAYARNNPQVEIVCLSENLGSAGGYKAGLQNAFKDKECEFIWLLDDDNEPQRGSLNRLIDFWCGLDNKNKEKTTALASYRDHFKDYDRAILTSNSTISIGRKNSHFRFHVFDMPDILFEQISEVIKKKFKPGYIKDKFLHTKPRNMAICTAAYGGLFFHKNLINTIGYPKEDFFLYVDDTEWTYRITKAGGKIILLLDSQIKDIDFAYENKPAIFNNIIVSGGADFRIYYLVRNRVFFELSEFVDNRFIYFLNAKIFMFIISFFAKKEKVSITKIGFKDGLNGKMGKTFFVE